MAGEVASKIPLDFSGARFGELYAFVKEMEAERIKSGLKNPREVLELVNNGKSKDQINRNKNMYVWLSKMDLLDKDGFLKPVDFKKEVQYLEPAAKKDYQDKMLTLNAAKNEYKHDKKMLRKCRRQGIVGHLLRLGVVALGVIAVAGVFFALPAIAGVVAGAIGGAASFGAALGIGVIAGVGGYYAYRIGQRFIKWAFEKASGLINEAREKGAGWRERINGKGDKQGSKEAFKEMQAAYEDALSRYDEINNEFFKIDVSEEDKTNAKANNELLNELNSYYTSFTDTENPYQEKLKQVTAKYNELINGAETFGDIATAKSWLDAQLNGIPTKKEVERLAELKTEIEAKKATVDSDYFESRKEAATKEFDKKEETRAALAKEFDRKAFAEFEKTATETDTLTKTQRIAEELKEISMLSATKKNTNLNEILSCPYAAARYIEELTNKVEEGKRGRIIIEFKHPDGKEDISDDLKAKLLEKPAFEVEKELDKKRKKGRKHYSIETTEEAIEEAVISVPDRVKSKADTEAERKGRVEKITTADKDLAETGEELVEKTTKRVEKLDAELSGAEGRKEFAEKIKKQAEKSSIAKERKATKLTEEADILKTTRSDASMIAYLEKRYEEKFADLEKLEKRTGGDTSKKPKAFKKLSDEIDKTSAMIEKLKNGTKEEKAATRKQFREEIVKPIIEAAKTTTTSAESSKADISSAEEQLKKATKDVAEKKSELDVAKKDLKKAEEVKKLEDNEAKIEESKKAAIEKATDTIDKKPAKPKAAEKPVEEPKVTPATEPIITPAAEPIITPAEPVVTPAVEPAEETFSDTEPEAKPTKSEEKSEEELEEESSERV